jgi:predicted aldo/keto reductase-like oxidoreductase
MQYRRFGRTNLQVPVFSCGGMRFQYKWQDVPLADIPAESQANLEATVRRALDLGITHIETARGYGSSERQLGQILPQFPRDRLIVQTKIIPDKDPAVFTRHFEESLQRLNLQYVDLLALHGLNNDQTIEYALGPNGSGGCLAAARALQHRGLARHIGFSTHAPTRDILALLRHDRDGGFDYVNLHWYYIFQKHWPAIEEAARRDIGVFIISPADKGGQLYKPPAKLVDLCAPLSPLAFNALFCLARPQVHTLSVGAARPGDFDAHLEALPFLDRAAEILPPILARLAAALDALPPALRDPFALPLPEWQDAPGQMNIPVMLWLRTLATAFDMTAYGQMRYNLLGNGGHWFPGLNAANVAAADLSALDAAAGLNGQLKPLLEETHRLLWKEPVKRLSQS